MASSTIKAEMVTKAFSSPAFTYIGGTIGTILATHTFDVSLSGFTPVGVCLNGLGHAGSYILVPELNGNTVLVYVYRARAGGPYDYTSGEYKITVLYR